MWKPSRRCTRASAPYTRSWNWMRVQSSWSAKVARWPWSTAMQSRTATQTRFRSTWPHSLVSTTQWPKFHDVNWILSKGSWSVWTTVMWSPKFAPATNTTSKKEWIPNSQRLTDGIYSTTLMIWRILTRFSSTKSLLKGKMLKSKLSLEKARHLNI